ncbi:unnamed protein product [Porites lobata]|uniref:Reverse transcriptase domain-containing protein n=1 Tax=Porites lobata TaxID=104759 RepID=A0ABN8PRW0_9CNID|nr:unnamed protein product [Porites lobata]
MYADDTSLTYASADLNLINDCVNDDLNKVYIWLSANKLTLNLTKTEFMLKRFSYNGAKLWNSLSHDLRSADSLHDFKRKLCRNSFE